VLSAVRRLARRERAVGRVSAIVISAAVASTLAATAAGAAVTEQAAASSTHPSPSPTQSAGNKPETGKPANKPKPGAASSTTPSAFGSPAIGADAALQQAQDQLAALRAASARNSALLTKATAAQAVATSQISAMAAQIQQAEAMMVQVARDAYMSGVDPGVLSEISALNSTDLSAMVETQQSLSRVSTMQSQRSQAAAALLASVEKQRSEAAAEVATAQRNLAEALSLETSAREQLAAAQKAVAGARTAQTFSTYTPNECSFSTAPTPSSCLQAQQWALAQVANPTRNWYNSCLNFVTEAYGVSGGAPTAIAMWNSLPAADKHPPTTVAPAGALMFWGPNHVALSLGDNVLISTDVLGNGRAWIVSFAEMQTAWHLQYLGWSPPDFALTG